MISTLIRGNDLPRDIHGRSEYLVDTENNTIIYPKTRIQDIIGLEDYKPNSGPAMQIVTKKVDISGVVIPYSEIVLCTTEIDTPQGMGVYFCSAEIHYGLTPTMNQVGRYKHITMRNPNSGNEAVDSNLVNETATGICITTLKGFTNHRQDTPLMLRLHYNNTLDSSTRTIKSGAFVYFKVFKLGDLPK